MDIGLLIKDGVCMSNSSFGNDQMEYCLEEDAETALKCTGKE